MPQGTLNLNMIVQEPVEGGSYLLSLPTEIRDMIYAFALSATSRQSSLVYKSPNPYQVRGILYDDSPGARTDTVVREFNQLKRVNRQLHMETSHLELRYNEVTLQQTECLRAEAPVERLCWFVSLLPTGKLLWLTRVVLTQPLFVMRREKLQGCLKSAIQSWELLANQFQAYPHLSIKYVLPSFNSSTLLGRHCAYDEDAWLFMFAGIQLAMALRGQDLSYLMAPFGTWNDSMVFGTAHLHLRENLNALQWDKAKKLEKRFPNFRIYPDLVDLSKSWIGSASRNIDYASGSAQLLLQWILFAKEWIERGI